MWVSILAMREKAGLFIGCISMLIDLYCLLSVGLLSCCSMVIEFSLSVRGKQYFGQGKCLWMSWSVPHSPFLFLLFSLSASCILTSPPSAALHTVFPASLYSLRGLICYIAYVYFKNAWQAFYVNCSPTARTFQSFSSDILLSPPFLFPPSSAGTWAATWGPGDKRWCVSRVWPRWPVAGSHQTAHQRGICPRCLSGPCGHLLRLCA